MCRILILFEFKHLQKPSTEFRPNHAVDQELDETVQDDQEPSCKVHDVDKHRMMVVIFMEVAPVSIGVLQQLLDTKEYSGEVGEQEHQNHHHHSFGQHELAFSFSAQIVS